MAEITNRSSGQLIREVHRLFCAGTVVGLTDGQLLDRFVAGKGEDAEAAFEELMHRHGPMVLRVCHGKLGDQPSAEDAFQATFLVLAQRARAIRRPESVSSWLFGVARRVSAHSRLCSARRRAGERLAAAQTPEAQLAEAKGADSEVLLHEIEHLPERLRGVVALCYLEGMTYEGAARALGISETAIRGRLARAREQLRVRLSRRGLMLPAGFIAAGTIGEAHAAHALPVTAALIESTIRMALGFTAGAAADALARGVLRSMFLSNLRAAAAVLLVTAASSSLAWQALAARDGEEAPKSQPKSSTADGKNQDAPPKSSDDFTRNKQPYTAVVEVRDMATGGPIVGANVEGSYEGGKKRESITDAHGNATLAIPDLNGSYYLSVRVARAGYVPLAIPWSQTPRSTAPPGRFRFQMEKATTIGGRAVDQDERPIAGATVVINVRKRYSNPAQNANLSFVSTKTDENGRWTFSGVPARPDIAAAYGATAIPTNVLIGPDGKIVAKDLFGDKLKTTISELLKQPAAAEKN